jgi:hypothetical protein
MGKFLAISVYLLTLLLPINTQAQSAAAKFAGMWSDPLTPRGSILFFLLLRLCARSAGTAAG